MSIKGALGKLDAPDDLARQVQRHRFQVLPIHFDHAMKVGRLPPLHGDPFDRMLIAQAQVEEVSIVSRDKQIARYEVDFVDATQ